MSHYKLYPAYKDSKNQFLGRVPEHWEVKRLGYECQILTGFAFQSEKFSFDNGTPLVRGDNVTEGYLRWGEKSRFWPTPTSELDRFYLSPGDVLIGMDGSKVGKNYAMVAPDDGKMLLVQRVARIRVDERLKPAWVYKFIGSKIFQSWVNLIRTDPAIPHISPKDIYDFKICVPPLSEQKEILECLDRETTRIDALITKKTRFIELLREKRQALITHAVTKGLDPNVKMKDSGVEWLGEVPEHWDVKPIKWLSPVQRGASPRPIDDPKYFDDDGKYGWVRIEDVSSSGGYLIETKQKLSNLGASLSVKLPIGSLFLSIAGTVGKPCISLVDACIHDGFVYFPLLKINPAWLFRIFECKMPFVGLGKMGTQLNLNTETVGGIFVGLPPAEELSNIVEKLKEKLVRIEKTIIRSERSVELLKERRSALITAAVTGQIDLREGNQ